MPAFHISYDIEEEGNGPQIRDKLEAWLDARGNKVTQTSFLITEDSTAKKIAKFLSKWLRSSMNDRVCVSEVAGTEAYSVNAISDDS
jgi:hypothetical protein